MMDRAKHALGVGETTCELSTQHECVRLLPVFALFYAAVWSMQLLF